MDEKTQATHDWMKSLDDNGKMRFALNWGLPHSIFNVACAMKGGHKELQGIDWFKIFKTKDLGVWAHGGKVYPIPS